MELDWQPLKGHEKLILERLFECEFQGRNELRQQLEFVTARSIDENGSLALKVSSPILAKTKCRVPVEAEYLDVDGVPIWILLHVVDGLLNELEILRADSAKMQNFPRPDQFVPMTVSYE